MTLELLLQIIKEQMAVLTKESKTNKIDEVAVSCEFARRQLNRVLEEYEKRKSQLPPEVERVIRHGYDEALK